MTKLLNNVKIATQNMTCKEHGKKAEFEINGDEIQINACCESFRNEISVIMEKVIHKHIQNEAGDAFKNLGRK